MGEAVPPTAPAQEGVRWTPLIAGIALIVLFFRMAQGLRFGSNAGVGLAHLASFELSFWLSHALLVFPAALLVAWGLERPLSERLGALVTRASEASPQARTLGLLLLAVAVFALSRVLREVVFLGLPITDEENTALYGARIFAAGRLFAPVPQPEEAFPILFTYRSGGLMTAFDYPGGLFFRTVSLVTGLDQALYALWAGLTAVAVAVAGRRLAGERGLLLSALIWTLSPAVLWLSSTTHAHVVSRGFIALTLAIWAGLVTTEVERWRPRDLALLGLCGGLAFFTRPVEASALLLPPALLILRRALGRRRSLVLFALLGLAVPVLAFAAYNSATTGSWYLPARFAEGAANFTRIPSTFADRLSLNLGLNLLLLCCFFLGPLGVALVISGCSARGASAGAARALAAGALLHLGVALLHSDTGIHSVGPIHYSDTVVSLTLLAAIGAGEWSERLGGDPRWPRRVAWALTATLLISAPVFHVIHGAALLEQARNQQAPLLALRRADLRAAIVLAPQAAAYWFDHPTRARSGSWVLEFPPPDPFLGDDVLVVSRPVELGRLRERFPGRAFFRMDFPEGDGPITLRPLPAGGPARPEGAPPL